MENNTLHMTPEVVERYTDFLVNPKKWGCTYKPLHEVFVEGDHYEPQHLLYNAYIDYIKKPLPKFMFYIIMKEQFQQFGGVDKDEKYGGQFGYKLKLNID